MPPHSVFGLKPILLSSRPTVESLKALPVMLQKVASPDYGGCRVLLDILFEELLRGLVRLRRPRRGPRHAGPAEGFPVTHGRRTVEVILALLGRLSPVASPLPLPRAMILSKSEPAAYGSDYCGPARPTSSATSPSNLPKFSLKRPASFFACSSWE